MSLTKIVSKMWQSSRISKVATTLALSAVLYTGTANNESYAQHNNNRGPGLEFDLGINSPRDEFPEDEDPEPVIEEDDVELYGEEVPSGGGICYVIDISGSMRANTPTYTDLEGNVVDGSTRIARAKVELTRSIAALSENYKFNIISYNCASSLFKSGLIDATPANKARAYAWINRLQAGGGTGTGPATVLALNDAEVDTVALSSDGGPNCGATAYNGHRTMIRAGNKNGALVHTFGISLTPGSGQENFMRSVAQDNGGMYINVP